MSSGWADQMTPDYDDLKVGNARQVGARGPVQGSQSERWGAVTNILLTVDALHYAPEATEMARELCHGPEDKIIILHVHEFAVGRFGRVQVDCPEGEAEGLVARIRASLTDAGIATDAEIRDAHVGQVARTIIEAADEHDARIIVLGSAKSTDLPHVPFGSVSLKVLHLAKRPVMLVPRHAVGVIEQAAAIGASGIPLNAWTL
jgi:nucleotide-binding universal stress UspA family protein